MKSHSGFKFIEHDLLSELEIKLHTSSEDFLEACQEWLLAREPFYHGLISSADLIGRNSPIFSPPYGFISIRDQDSTVGCAIHVLPDGLLLSEIPKESVSELAITVCTKIVEPHRVIGHPQWTEDIAIQIAKYSGKRSILEAIWDIYCIESVSTVSNTPPGRLRRGESTDWRKLQKWAAMYEEEKPSPISVEAYFAFKLKEGDLFIWEENSEAKAVATTAARTENAIKISSVFTPPSLRCQGYASAAVHSLSDYLLRDGNRFVTLAALEDDGTALLYEKLGFKKIGQRISYNIHR